MHTHWLVALLAGLLFFESIRSLSQGKATLPRFSWTTSDFLLGLSLIVSLFCLGLSWHYHVQSVEQEVSLGEDWFPYVVGLLALCLLVGFLQSWRNRDDAQDIIEDPYYLLETSAPLTEPPLFESKRHRSIAITGGTLVLSILIGFIGAAVLLEADTSEGTDPFFAVDRVRPTPHGNESTMGSAFEPLAQSEDNNAPESSVAGVKVIDPTVTSRPGIGGPVSDTTIAVIANAASGLTPSDWYGVTIQAAPGASVQPTPSTESEPLAILPKGSQYHATGRTADGIWVRILLDNYGEGWIAASAVGNSISDPNQLSVPIEALPIVAANR